MKLILQWYLFEYIVSLLWPIKSSTGLKISWDYPFEEVHDHEKMSDLQWVSVGHFVDNPLGELVPGHLHHVVLPLPYQVNKGNRYR